MADEQAAAPDNTTVRVALWRAMHVQVDPPPHVLDDEIGLRVAPQARAGAAARTWPPCHQRRPETATVPGEEKHMSYPEPKYLSAGGEVSAVLRRAGHPYDLEMGSGGTQVHYLATGAATKGEFGLYRWDFTGPPSGPDPHFHKTISESFYVLSGTVRLYDGRHWIDASPGDFLFVPQGGIHSFRNESGEPASMLLHFAPGAPREGYFESLAEWAVTGNRPSAEERAEFMLQHDTYWIDT